MRPIALAAALLALPFASYGSTPEQLQRAANAHDDEWQEGASGWVASQRELHAGFRGTRGRVIQIGDSITYANPNTQWMRYGKGRTQSDNAIRRWMRVDDSDRKNDGAYLARTDRPSHRSYTAETGMTTGEFLRRPKRGLPSATEMFKTGRAKEAPFNDFTGGLAAEVCFLMLGTNDASSRRPVDEYTRNMTQIIRLIAANHTVVVLVTIPPHVHQQQLAQQYNAVLRRIAKNGITVPGVNGGKPVTFPLVDYYEEIVRRRPSGTWGGTLLNKGDVHPTARNSAGNPYANGGKALTESGYLLRSWLIVQKAKEIKSRVIDGR